MKKRDKELLKTTESLSDAVDDLSYSITKMKRLIKQIPDRDIEDRNQHVDQFNSVIINLRELCDRVYICNSKGMYRQYIT